MISNENKQVIMRCIDSFNKCTLEWVDTFYSTNLEWLELPMQTSPQGRCGDLKIFRNSAEQALKIFPDRKLTVLRSVSENDLVVLEQEWKGTSAFTIGNFVKDHIIKLRIASFFELENGLIVRQTDYCTPAI
jgi:hypothetical protein